MAKPAAQAEASSALPWLLIAYAALVFLGAALLAAPFAMRPGNGLSLQRAMFAACDAVSLTGFPTTAMRPVDVAAPGKWTLFGLTAASVILTLTTAGYAMARASRSNLSLARVFAGSIICTVLATLIGAAGLTNDRTALFDASLNALAAFGNSAVHSGPVLGADSARTYLVLLPLSILGALGTAAMVDLFNGRISKLTRQAIKLTAGGYLICFGLLCLAYLVSGSSSNVAMNSSVLSLTTRTLGLPIVEVRELPRVVQWSLMPLMMAGGVSGGTAGGLKLTTLLVLVMAVRSMLQGKPVPRVAGIAATWVAIYVVAFVLTTLFLLSAEAEIGTDQAPFLAISALSCVGLSRDPVSITGDGLYVLSLAMLLGRTLPLAVLWSSVNEPGEPMPVG